jgi:hypothetical protein
LVLNVFDRHQPTFRSRRCQRRETSPQGYGRSGRSSRPVGMPQLCCGLRRYRLDLDPARFVCSGISRCGSMVRSQYSSDRAVAQNRDRFSSPYPPESNGYDVPKSGCSLDVPAWFRRVTEIDLVGSLRPSRGARMIFVALSRERLSPIGVLSGCGSGRCRWRL